MKYCYHPYIFSALHLIFIFTMHAFSSSEVEAKGIFKCVKPNGEVEYTQSPSQECQEHNTKEMKNTGGRADPVAIAKQKEKKENTLKAEESRKIETLKQQDQNLANQERQNYCNEVQKNLHQIKNTPRMFKTDKQGNRSILTEEERQTKIQRSKENLAAHCS